MVAYDALRGRYLVATLAAPDLAVSSSSDGVAWTAPTTATAGFVDKEWLTCDGGDNALLGFEDTVSAEPVVRPNGELVVFFFEGRRIRASRPADGGASFAPREAVTDLSWRTYSFAPERLRAVNVSSVAVDAAGTLYAA